VTNSSAQVTITTPGQAPATQTIDASKESGLPADLTGAAWLAGQIAQKVCVQVLFEGEVTVAFEGLGGDPNPLEGGLGLQAVILEAVPAMGGVTLQAISLSEEP